MKWIGLCFFSFWLQAQNLKQGVYYNLKPTEALVLDTGSYTFIGCAFSPPLSLGEGPGVRLDGRKARSHPLVNCTFEGNGNGMGEWSSGDLTVNHSSFTNMEEGIVQESPAGQGAKGGEPYHANWMQIGHR